MSAIATKSAPAPDGIRAQLLFRELNEQIHSIATGRDLDVICECTNSSCFERLAVPVDVYEAARRFPTRFVVKPGHVAADVERPVDVRDGLIVVEKSGPDAEPAIMLDPRRGAVRRARA